ncbi:MAG: PqqD family protein [Planctomycetes bacterium]|nr:PqqD family protein [Planctomycetota bacterium]
MPRRTPGPASLAEQIAAIPVRNHAVRVAEDAGGASAVVTVPLVYGSVLRPVAAALKLRREKSFRLDALGYRLFQRVDGATTVAGLADWLKDGHQLSFHEARVLVMRYLQMLMLRGLVVLAKPLPPV